MRRGKAFTLIELIVMVLVSIVVLGLLFGVVLRRARERYLQTECYCTKCQVGLSMIQYAGDHDDAFMPLVDAAGNLVPAVDNAGRLSSLPARTAFVVLLHEGYLTTTKVFVCPGSGDRVNEDFPEDYKAASLAELVAAFRDENCSLGWDPTKKHSADATCAILSDKPSKDVSVANEGTAKNNSDTHGKRWQYVFYNAGHLKLGYTPQPDSGDDPDFYTGAPGYETSNTDAKIIR